LCFFFQEERHYYPYLKKICMHKFEKYMCLMVFMKDVTKELTSYKN